MKDTGITAVAIFNNCCSFFVAAAEMKLFTNRVSQAAQLFQTYLFSHRVNRIDCGELSGWMYKVNGNFPRYGCSQYTVNKGDKIEWIYTCNLGMDIGDNSGTKNGYNITQ